MSLNLGSIQKCYAREAPIRNIQLNLPPPPSLPPSGSVRVHGLGQLVEFSDRPSHLLPDKFRCCCPRVNRRGGGRGGEGEGGGGRGERGGEERGKGERGGEGGGDERGRGGEERGREGRGGEGELKGSRRHMALA